MAFTTPQLERDYTLFVQLEATYNTSPGALAGTDAAKVTSGKALKRVLERYDRDKEKDNGQASVLQTFAGREKSTWSIEAEMIPSGVTTPPTAPDVTDLLEAHFGTKLTPAANTTTTTGSTGVTLNLTAGGVAAAGIVANMLIAVDQDGAGNYEVRRVVSIATDALTLDAGFTTASVATARAVQPLVTYKLSSSALKSVHIWEYLAGDNFRHKAGGCAVQNLEASIDNTQKAPMGMLKFSGEGSQMATHATAKPTTTTAGDPLVPTVSQAWIGSGPTPAKYCFIKGGFKSNNGIELREAEGCTLYPTGLKRTANNARFSIEANLSLFLLTGAIEGYFDNASSALLTAYTLNVQLGVLPGKRVAWSIPRFIPDVPDMVEGGEVALELSGRCYGTTADDEIFFAMG